jgi:hypothetical protein
MIFERQVETGDGQVRFNTNLNSDDVLNQLISRGKYDFIQSASDKLAKIFANEDYYFFNDLYMDLGNLLDKEKIRLILEKYPELFSLIAIKFKLTPISVYYKQKLSDVKYLYSDIWKMIYKDMPLEIRAEDILYHDYSNLFTDSIVEITRKDELENEFKVDNRYFRKTTPDGFYPMYSPEYQPKERIDRYKKHELYRLNEVKDLVDRVAWQNDLNERIYT